MSIKKGYVDVPDGQVHYRLTEGVSDAPVVMFHMTASTSESYEPLMTALDGRIDSIAFDTPNYGESFKSSREASMRYIATVMTDALEQIGIEKYHVLGHHTGASIAVEMAALNPERVLSATLSGLMYFTPEQGAELLLTKMPDMPLSERGEQLGWTWTRVLKFDTEYIPAEIINREVADTLKAGRSWHWGYQAVFSYDAPSRMADVTCPVFLVAGERDPARRWHAQAVKGLPSAREHLAPGHGVYYFETGAEDFAPLYLDFITN